MEIAIKFDTSTNEWYITINGLEVSGTATTNKADAEKKYATLCDELRP